MLQLRLFGTPYMILDGHTVSGLTSAKSLAILFYLAANRGRTHSRLVLAGMFWAEKTDQEARTNLRQAVRHIRLAVGDVLEATRDGLGLKEQPAWSADVINFEQLVTAGLSGQVERLTQAVALYTGEFLFGFYIDDAPDFETWMLLERERYRGLALQALYQLSRHHADHGDLLPAMQMTGRLLSLEPLHEESYRQMMRLLALDGQLNAALAQYETCRQILEAELGVAPAPETTAVFEEIRAGRLGPAQATRARTETIADRTGIPPRVRPHNLPRQFAPFVGRQADLAQISDWLAQPNCALVTIRGPGGIGKTRLALEVAHRCLDRFEDGAWFVDLASVADAANIYNAIAPGLGLDPPRAGDAKQRVLDHLAEAELLLILDNFEHLMDGVDALLGMLQLGRRCKFLVTSRESLNVQAEWLYELSGLPVPLVDEPMEGPSAAAQLFLTRLAQRQPGYEPTSADLAQIEMICTLVGGSPLAIELAAAQAHSQPLRTIAATISRDRDALGTTMRDLPARHRSLRAVFDYSWRLLVPDQQSALAALSIFQGSFNTVAAAQVAEASDPMLLCLLDKSFLHQPVSGRYEMHEVLRHYAEEKRVDSRGAEDIACRHGAYFLRFLQERSEAMLGPRANLAVDELQRELADLDAAWRWAVAARNLAEIEGSLTAIVRFFSRCGLYREGQSLMEYAADNLVQAASARLLGRLQAEKAYFSMVQADYSEAIITAQTAIALAEQAGDASGVARGHQVWGAALSNQGQLAEALEHLRQALDNSLKTGAWQRVGSILSGIGVVYYHLGEHEEARNHFEQARKAFQSAGDWGGEASVVNNLANIHVRTGAYAAAKDSYERAETIYQELGDRGGLGLVKLNLGIVALHRGELCEARSLVEQARSVFETRRMRWLEAAAHNTLGVVTIRQGQIERAVSHLKQSQDLAQRIGNQYTASEALANASLASLASGDLGIAESQAVEALRLARDVGETALVGYAASSLGEVLERQAYWSGAEEAYRRALKAWLEVGHPGLVAEARASLARVALGCEDVAEARLLADEILTYLEGDPSRAGQLLDGTERPALVLETCARVLTLSGDSRAEKWRALAVEAAQHQAAGILDERSRQVALAEVERLRLETWGGAGSGRQPQKSA